MFTTSSANSKRILIFRLGSLGDTLIALPALRLVRRAFPDAERRMITTFPPNAKAPPSSAVLEHTGLVHGYYRYTYGTRSFWEIVRLWWDIFRWRPQVMVYLGGERTLRTAQRDALFLRLCGIQKSFGVPVTNDMLQCRPEKAANGEWVLEPEASRLVRNISQLGDAYLSDPESWSLDITEEESSRALQELLPIGDRPMIAVCVGTKVQSKDWGIENWRALLARVAKLYGNHALVLCGALDEFGVSESAAAVWRENADSPALNLCGSVNARVSAAVFARAVLFLGHDSGPMHLAASVQTPCIAIFAARNIPRVWFPYGDQHRILYHHVECAGCGLEVCIEERKRCILSITVDEVIREIKKALGPEDLVRQHD